jgi:hypothetical protein
LEEEEGEEIDEGRCGDEKEDDELLIGIAGTD